MKTINLKIWKGYVIYIFREGKTITGFYGYIPKNPFFQHNPKFAEHLIEAYKIGGLK